MFIARRKILPDRGAHDADQDALQHEDTANLRTPRAHGHQYGDVAVLLHHHHH
jgi:hypothetical protein